jgi:hypothetical protein
MRRVAFWDSTQVFPDIVESEYGGLWQYNSPQIYELRCRATCERTFALGSATADAVCLEYVLDEAVRWSKFRAKSHRNAPPL